MNIFNLILQILNLIHINLNTLIQSIASITAVILAVVGIILAKKYTAFNFKLRQFELRPEMRVESADLLLRNGYESAKNPPLLGMEIFYYKVIVKNVGNSMAIITNAQLYLEDQIPRNFETYFGRPISLVTNSVQSLFLYNAIARKLKDETDSEYPQNISHLKIFYKDIFNNQFECTALVNISLAEPAPYLSTQQNIDHEYKYPINFLPKL